ncbi:hypothetical protein N7U49_01850 [Streptomyces sp. AD2-2]|nr:hypothetical protein N7U49_01850 [Streptomyces sp. AD2-2]
MAEADVKHPWLGTVRRHGEGQMLALLQVDPAVRPARMNGQTDVEVLITVEPGLNGPALDAVVEMSAERIRIALADLGDIKAFALAHTPGGWRRHYEAVERTSLEDRLFLEGFAIVSPVEMEVAFDFGDLDMLVVRLDARGRGRDVRIAP